MSPVVRFRTLMANVYFVRAERGWVLIDAGVMGYAAAIRARAARLFGSSSRPAAIILTHGHFDHVGALPQLAEAWGVPIYAHPLELPYLTGRSAYPPPDPTAGGGMISLLSPLYPAGPIDLGDRIRLLPADGTVPGLAGWQWIHTPGHTAGHVSLFNDASHTLIAGDAVVTTKQESLVNVVMQRPIVWRPPAYYTSDWRAARRSVETLAALNPEVLATGHGCTLRGPAMRNALRDLAAHFDEVRPRNGRYVRVPATADHRGVVSVPPSAIGRRQQVAAALTVAGAVALAVALARPRARAA
jgi:glyoxylase-like metal-dependent hydrolase (beta-lactamase superfamily II)